VKVTKAQLKQIIKEEISKEISADDLYLAEMFPTGTSGLEEKCRDADGQMMANQCVGPDGKPIKLQEEEKSPQELACERKAEKYGEPYVWNSATGECELAN